MFPKQTIDAFDLYMLRLGLRFEGVVIGGSALALLGVIQRPTRDFDVLVPELPPVVAEAARGFARDNPALRLAGDWLNNGPLQLSEVLPSGWREELKEPLPWLEEQDGNEFWPEHVRSTLAELSLRLGHGL